MAPKKENTKKVAGNAKKAEAAAAKAAVANAQVAAEEDDKWSKGAKSNAKKEAAAEKAAEAERKKAEKAAILAEEEKDARAVPKGANKKTAEKKSKGTLNLDQLDAPMDSKRAPTLNATGIDNALDALDLTSNDNSAKVDRHPERRFKAAYKVFEERRLPEVKLEHPGLRENQRKDIIRKEFEKSEENPFNQANVISYDADKEAIRERREEVKKGIEGRLGRSEGCVCS